MNSAETISTVVPPRTFRKDATLDQLAERFNVAQFVSFAPSRVGPLQQFCRIAGLPPNTKFESLDAAVRTLLERSGEGSVNIRSFSEHQSQSREFLYGLTSVGEAVEALGRLSSEGSYTIVNETIDVSDGGVSGVSMDGLVEFGPDTTPRGVEKAGFAALPHAWAMKILTTVYGFRPEIDAGLTGRLEFSLHPEPRGWKRSHVIHWEFGPSSEIERIVDPSWPNNFSRMIGDKVYGLLVADAIGLPVPETTVIGRRVAPFSFGRKTGSFEHWLRTSPIEQVPGKFTTSRRWTDPFRLLQKEDSSNSAIASVLAQRAVPAQWSGAAIEDAGGNVIIEGTAGSGEAFMLGSVAPTELPESVRSAVTASFLKLRSALGPARFEWVFDGLQLWIVQLHKGSSPSRGTRIVPGEPKHWVAFQVSRGLEELRDLISTLPPDTGILLDGEVGLTSHIADVIRKANVPAKMRSFAQGDGG